MKRFPSKLSVSHPGFRWLSWASWMTVMWKLRGGSMILYLIVGCRYHLSGTWWYRGEIAVSHPKGLLCQDPPWLWVLLWPWMTVTVCALVFSSRKFVKLQIEICKNDLWGPLISSDFVACINYLNLTRAGYSARIPEGQHASLPSVELWLKLEQAESLHGSPSWDIGRGFDSFAHGKR